MCCCRYSYRGIVGWATAAFLLASLAPPGGLAEEPAGLRFSNRCLMVSPNEGCAVADVNRDGRPDVIAGTHWFAAPDFVPRPLRDIPEVSLGFGDNEFYANNGDHVWDVDGDGWIDVLSGGWTEPELCWYKNPGSKGLEKGSFVGQECTLRFTAADLRRAA